MPKYQAPLRDMKFLLYDVLEIGTYSNLPRFSEASFEARFPFGTVTLRDPSLPIEAKITGWSPFIPGNADHSGLPVAAWPARALAWWKRPAVH